MAWRAAVAEHLRRLRREHARVYGVGLSMGGLLTLDAAADDAYEALAVVGVPLRFPRALEWAVGALRFVAPVRPKSAGSDIRDPAARARHPSSDAMPLQAVHQLFALQRRVRARLARVRAPVFVGHGALDRTASPRDARAIHAGVSATVRELVFYERSGHVVPVDWDGAALATAAADFLAARGADAPEGQSPRNRGA
jgi:carboxylesterase